MGWSTPGSWGNNSGWSRAAVVAATTTLNPSDKSANVTLTNGNLTAQNTVAGYNGVRSVASFAGSKKFFSVQVTGFALSNGFIGISPGGVSTTSGDVLFVSGDGAAVTGDGNIHVDGSTTGASIGSVADGDIIDVAVDDSVKKIWFRRNGGSWDGTTDNPATGTGGATYTASGSLYAYLSTYETAYTLTANFGGSAYTYPAPLGFGTL